MTARRGSAMRARLVCVLIALMAMTIGATAADLLITISKARQSMTVTLDGQTKYKWPVSTGARGYDTPSGDFRPFRMEAEHFSKEWDDAPMPHSIFFTGRGHAIHGSFHTKRLGQRASHGCVRLAPGNAATLFALVRKVGMSRTRVEVGGGGLFDWGGGNAEPKDKKPKRKKKSKNWLFGGLGA